MFQTTNQNKNSWYSHLQTSPTYSCHCTDDLGVALRHAHPPRICCSLGRTATSIYWDDVHWGTLGRTSWLKHEHSPAKQKNTMSFRKITSLTVIYGEVTTVHPNLCFLGKLLLHLTHQTPKKEAFHSPGHSIINFMTFLSWREQNWYELMHTGNQVIGGAFSIWEAARNFGEQLASSIKHC